MDHGQSAPYQFRRFGSGAVIVDISYVNSSDLGDNNGSNNTYTVAYTIGGGANRCLVLTIEGDVTADIAAPLPTVTTYNGVPMVLALPNDNFGNAGALRYNYIYYLLEASLPVAGTYNFIVTFAGTQIIILSCAEYNGVGWLDSVARHNSGGAAVTSLTSSITTRTDNSWIVVLEQHNGGATVAGSGLTLRVNNAHFVQPAILDSNGPLTPVGSKSVTTTSASALTAHTLISLAPATATIPSAAFLARTSGFGPLRTAAYTSLINTLVANSVWAKLDALYLLATLNEATSWLNLVSTSFSLTKNGTPTFVVDQGYAGDDTNTPVTKYLDTGYVPASAHGVFTLDWGHISAWSNTNLQSANSGGGCLLGLYEGGGGGGDAHTRIVPWTSANTLIYAINGTGDGSVASTTAAGFWVSSRLMGNITVAYKNATVLATDSATGVPTDLSTSTSSIVLLALGAISASPQNGSANQMAFASIGGNLAALDVTNLYNALNTYHALLPFGSDPVASSGTTTYHWNLGVNV